MPSEDRSPREFEKYVEAVMATLAVFANGRVSRNRKLPGTRQPGLYEIDVVLEFTIENALAFLVIVECKKWNKPVDRPVVQKLMQTRDAVGAHKAVIVSPTGFTAEATALGKAERIGLWVLGSDGDDGIIGASHSHRIADLIATALWKELCRRLLVIVGAPRLRKTRYEVLLWELYLRRERNYFVGCMPQPAIDFSSAGGFGIAEFFDELVQTEMISDNRISASQIIAEWENDTRKALATIEIPVDDCTSIVRAIIDSGSVRCKGCGERVFTSKLSECREITPEQYERFCLAWPPR